MKVCPECEKQYGLEVDVCPLDGSILSAADSGVDSLIGSVIDGKYRIDMPLGRGAMGTVYKAAHIMMGRTVALKILRDNLAAHDEEQDEFLQRFQREARTASRIEHPNAVTIYDFGIYEKKPYLVMQFIEGVELKEVLRKKGPLPLRRALRITSQVCSAIAAAHKLGIIHRDLKPDNIMLSVCEDGTEHVTVLDFGLAKFLEDSDRASMTQSGIVMGTPQYMSPEQVQGETLYKTSDVYALGVVVYEMLAGKPPFQSEKSVDLMMKHVQEKPVTIRKFRPELRSLGGLDQAIMKALLKNPKERQQSVVDFAKELKVQELTQLEGEGDLASSGSGGWLLSSWRSNAAAACFGFLFLGMGFSAYPFLVVPTPEEQRIATRQASAAKYLDDGARLNAQENHSVAILSLKMALQLDPSSALTHYQLGYANAELGQFSEAETFLKEAVRLDPSFAQAFFELGNVHFRLGNRAEAKRAYRKTLKLNPKNARARSSYQLLKQ